MTPVPQSHVHLSADVAGSAIIVQSLILSSPSSPLSYSFFLHSLLSPPLVCTFPVCNSNNLCLNAEFCAGVSLDSAAPAQHRSSIVSKGSSFLHVIELFAATESATLSDDLIWRLV